MQKAIKKRLPVFDWIRAIAILIILLTHLPNYTVNFYDLNNFGIPLDITALNGLNPYFGLSLFIFVSGYLLNLKKKKFSNFREIYTFLKQKFLRIFPLYYLALLFFCLMYEVSDPLRIIFHLLGVQLLVSKNILTLWFIGLITVYYFLFVLLKSSFLDKKIRGSILVLFPLILLPLSRYFQITDSRLYLYYIIFFFGIFVAEKELTQQQVWKYLSYTSLVCFVLMFVYLFSNYDAIIGPGSRLLLRFSLVNILILSFTITVYNLCDWLSKHLNGLSKVFTTVAYAAYGMYLFHRPILYSLKNFFINLFQVKNDYTLLFLLAFCGLPIIFGVSYVLQFLYDRYIYTALKSNIQSSSGS